MNRRQTVGTILAIEDEPDVRQFVSRVLTLEGYTVLEAENGEAGLATLAAAGLGQIDLVLLDLKLPSRDGWSVLEEMKRQSQSSTLPVVVFSAFAGSDHQEKAHLLGAAAYLVKPLSAGDLVKSVKAVLCRKRQPENG